MASYRAQTTRLMRQSQTRIKNSVGWSRLPETAKALKTCDSLWLYNSLTKKTFNWVFFHIS